MKTPKFWNKKGIISTLLLPAGWIYSSLTGMRMHFIKPANIHAPVICVGNLTAGGTGKTPVCISIAEMLQGESLHPFFVSRGYGGKLKGVLVNNKIHTSDDVGDEPLLLSKQAPIVVDSDRYEAAKFSMDLGANIIIMDDGFQNPILFKDLSFIVVDGGFGFGNKRPIPAGPLRESLKKGLKRTDAVIIIGEDIKGIKEVIKELPVFNGFMQPAIKSLKGKKVIAFAGIGRPSKFYDSLRSLHADIISTIDYPDHHVYHKSELEKLIMTAKEQNAELYTTSKDFVKIPRDLQEKFKVLEIKIKWENEEELKKFILEHIKFPKKS